MLFKKYQTVRTQLISQAIELAAIYHGNYTHICQLTDRQTAAIKFAKVGKSALHRGYYCPNPIKERLVGNNSRGRLVKTDGPASNFYYNFNCQETLIGAHKKGATINTDEFLIYTSNVCWGIEYSCKAGNTWLNHISSTVFEEGKVTLAVDFLFDATRLRSIRGWCFDYTTDGQLTAALSSDCAVYNGLLDDHDLIRYYDFLHNCNGDITQYRCIQPPVWTRENQDYRNLSRPIKQESWHDPRGMLPSYWASLKK